MFSGYHGAGLTTCPPEFRISERLKHFGWLVPAYTIRAGDADINLMRVVVRADLTLERMKAFVRDLEKVCEPCVTRGSAIANFNQVVKELEH